MIADTVVDRGLLPDPVLRAAIRANCRVRLLREHRRGETAAGFARRSRDAPIALVPERANDQHYEVPPAFFESCLGPRLKYSGCLWPAGTRSLGEAEDAMLAQSCERAGIEDGMEILDLGCGWGSLSFWLRERYPASRVVAVSNSSLQSAHIAERAARLGVDGLDVLTADMNDFDTARRFDRIVSIEMFEHMRNYERLLARVATWLKSDGRLFVHVFSHARHAYAFGGSWMGRTFFSGGTMPSHELLPSFDRDVVLEQAWRVDGTHYARTAEAWLARLDANEEAAVAALATAYGAAGAGRQLARWRAFFLCCAELFAYAGGREWGVSHYRFAPARSST